MGQNPKEKTTGGLNEIVRISPNLTRGPGFESRPWEYNNFKSRVVELCRL